MNVKELVSELDYLASHNMIDNDTELILFAEHLPGMAAQLDTLCFSVNGNCLQLFMQYENKHNDGQIYHPLEE